MLILLIILLLWTIPSSGGRKVDFPGGSWIATARRAKVERLVGDGCNDEDGDIFLLKAQLKSKYWQGFFRGYWRPAETIFRQGNEFANENGRFVPQDVSDALRREAKRHERPTSVGQCWATLILLLTPFDIFWAEYQQTRWANVQSELAVMEAELSRLHKELIKTLKEKQQVQLELSKANQRLAHLEDMTIR